MTNFLTVEIWNLTHYSAWYFRLARHAAFPPSFWGRDSQETLSGLPLGFSSAVYIFIMQRSKSFRNSNTEIYFIRKSDVTGWKPGDLVTVFLQARIRCWTVEGRLSRNLLAGMITNQVCYSSNFFNGGLVSHGMVKLNLYVSRRRQEMNQKWLFVCSGKFKCWFHFYTHYGQ